MVQNILNHPSASLAGTIHVLPDAELHINRPGSYCALKHQQTLSQAAGPAHAFSLTLALHDSQEQCRQTARRLRRLTAPTMPYYLNIWACSALPRRPIPTSGESHHRETPRRRRSSTPPCATLSLPQRSPLPPTGSWSGIRAASSSSQVHPQAALPHRRLGLPSHSILLLRLHPVVMPSHPRRLQPTPQPRHQHRRMRGSTLAL